MQRELKQLATQMCGNVDKVTIDSRQLRQVLSAQTDVTCRHFLTSTYVSGYNHASGMIKTHHNGVLCFATLPYLRGDTLLTGIT